MIVAYGLELGHIGGNLILNRWLKWQKLLINHSSQTLKQYTRLAEKLLRTVVIASSAAAKSKLLSS